MESADRKTRKSGYTYIKVRYHINNKCMNWTHNWEVISTCLSWCFNSETT